MAAFDKFLRQREAERRARKNRSEKRKELLLKHGMPLFHKYGIKKVIVFGSAAKGFSTESSDLDIVVMPLDAQSYWDFRFEFEEALGLPLDLYTETDDPRIIQKAVSSGDVVYEV
jgi:predicted nucleotidyltransferase